MPAGAASSPAVAIRSHIRLGKSSVQGLDLEPESDFGVIGSCAIRRRVRLEGSGCRVVLTERERQCREMARREGVRVDGRVDVSELAEHAEGLFAEGLVMRSDHLMHDGRRVTLDLIDAEEECGVHCLLTA